jgi:hypothetical protein
MCVGSGKECIFVIRLFSSRHNLMSSEHFYMKDALYITGGVERAWPSSLDRIFDSHSVLFSFLFFSRGETERDTFTTITSHSSTPPPKQLDDDDKDRDTMGKGTGKDSNHASNRHATETHAQTTVVVLVKTHRSVPFSSFL